MNYVQEEMICAGEGRIKPFHTFEVEQLEEMEDIRKNNDPSNEMRLSNMVPSFCFFSSSWERLTWIVLSVAIFIFIHNFRIHEIEMTTKNVDFFNVDLSSSSKDHNNNNQHPYQCVESVTTDQLFERFGITGEWDTKQDAEYMLDVMWYYHKDGEPIPIRGYPYLYVGSIGAAYNKEGAAMTRRENVHRMAEANKAFAHFAW